MKTTIAKLEALLERAERIEGPGRARLLAEYDRLMEEWKKPTEQTVETPGGSLEPRDAEVDAKTLALVAKAGKKGAEAVMREMESEPPKDDVGEEDGEKAELNGKCPNCGRDASGFVDLCGPCVIDKMNADDPPRWRKPRKGSKCVYCGKPSHKNGEPCNECAGVAEPEPQKSSLAQSVEAKAAMGINPLMDEIQTVEVEWKEAAPPLAIESPGRTHYILCDPDSRPQLSGQGMCWHVKNGSGRIASRVKGTTLARIVVLYEGEGGYHPENGLHEKFAAYRIPNAGIGKGTEWYELWPGNRIWAWLKEVNPKGLLDLLSGECETLRKRNNGAEPRGEPEVKQVGRRPDHPGPADVAQLLKALIKDPHLSKRKVRKLLGCGNPKAGRWLAYIRKLAELMERKGMER